MTNDELRNQIQGSVIDAVSEIFDGAIDQREALITASELICLGLRFANTWNLTNKQLEIDKLISVLCAREPIPANSWLRGIPGAMEQEWRRRQLETSIAQGSA
jgi:hypothetical protein